MIVNCYTLLQHIKIAFFRIYLLNTLSAKSKFSMQTLSYSSFKIQFFRYTVLYSLEYKVCTFMCGWGKFPLLAQVAMEGGWGEGGEGRSHLLPVPYINIFYNNKIHILKTMYPHPPSIIYFWVLQMNIHCKKNLQDSCICFDQTFLGLELFPARKSLVTYRLGTGILLTFFYSVHGYEEEL